MKKLSAFLLTLTMVSTLALSTLTACSSDVAVIGGADGPTEIYLTSDSSTAASDDTSSAADAATSDTITDLLGNEIAAPTATNKIVSLAPSFTEILVDLGLGDNLIAVDAYSSGLPGVPADLPMYDMMNLDAESLAALEADIIFTSDLSAGGGEDPLAPLTALGVCVIGAPAAASIEDIYNYVAFVGSCVGKDAEAAALVEAAQAEVAEVAAIAATIPADEKKTVMFEISALPYLYSFGNGVFLDEMITTIGATNVFADQTGWISVEEESAVNANPDCILTNVTYLDDAVAEILGRTGWEKVSAVANAQIASINNTASSNGNHTFTIALWEMAAAVYPDYFA